VKRVALTPLSFLHRIISEAMPDRTLSELVVVTSMRKYGGSRYGIRLDKGRLKIVESRER